MFFTQTKSLNELRNAYFVKTTNRQRNFIYTKLNVPCNIWTFIKKFL